jgi:hypothetical protein
VPAVQALITFFYQKLVKSETTNLNVAYRLFDVFQILVQMIVMNNLLYTMTDQESTCGKEGFPACIDDADMHLSD